MSVMTKAEVRAALDAAGYTTGSYADFLGLSVEEGAEVEARGAIRDPGGIAAVEGPLQSSSHNGQAFNLTAGEAADINGLTARRRPRRASKTITRK